MKKILTSVAAIICLLIILPNKNIYAQNVGIGTATPLEKLHVIGNIRSSTLAGAGNRVVLADPNGTLVVATGTTSPAWMTTGNTLTDVTVNFLGTTDLMAVGFRTNNLERMRILANGQVSVNNIAPFATAIFSSYATVTSDAVVGAATGSGDGVFGQNTSTGATPGSGVAGISTSATGFGVFGYNTNALGTGLISAGNNAPAGYATDGSGGAFTGTRIGVYSVSNIISAAVSSTGVIGRASAGTFTMLLGGAGVTGSAANSGVGVFAYNTGLTNLSHGVYSTISSLLAVPVLGSGGISGVQGQTTVAGGVGTSGFGGANGDGIFGTATGNLGYGINGFVTSGTSAIGVYGYADAGVATRYGGFFDNDLGTTGVKTFLIDHPLDPQNKLLKHFSMESPEVLNVYRGNVVLNSAGEGTITLPDYFDAVNNSNYSYQLTPIGNAAPVFVKSEINNKQFVVAGGNPGQKISWVVYTERNDLYMQQYPEERAAVVNKTNDAVGKYMSPQLYGQPAEMGIHYKNKSTLKAATSKTSEGGSVTTEKSIEVKQ